MLLLIIILEKIEVLKLFSNENQKFKEAYATNRRRFLDANPHESIEGIAGFMFKQSQEERDHMLKLIKFVKLNRLIRFKNEKINNLLAPQKLKLKLKTHKMKKIFFLLTPLPNKF